VHAIGGRPVQDTGALLREITALPPGQRTELTAVRAGKEILLTAEVGKRPAPQRRR
jgi:S1-C subfamily serine protease